MPRLVLADLTKPANLLSLARIPLGLAFPFVDDVRAALALLVVGGATDVLDGWVARRRNEATALGAVVDPIADKVFAGTIVVTLYLRHALPTWGIAALLSREILEAPLVLWVLAHAPSRRTRREEAKANVPGKLATAVQFGAVLSAIAFPAALRGWLVASAVAGTVAGLTYLEREIRWARGRNARPESPPRGGSTP